MTEPVPIDGLFEAHLTVNDLSRSAEFEARVSAGQPVVVTSAVNPTIRRTTS